jgi:hypothetical protein
LPIIVLLALRIYLISQITFCSGLNDTVNFTHQDLAAKKSRSIEFKTIAFIPQAHKAEATLPQTCCFQIEVNDGH